MLIIAASLFFQLGVSLRATHSARVNVDEPFYLLTTVSLLEDGDLDLINDYELRRYEAFFDYPGDLWSQSVPNHRGQLLSPHNVGLSALIMPAYALGGVDGVKRFLAVLGGLTVGLAALLAYRATGFFAPSLAAAAVLGISAPFFVFATQVYPEMPAALLTAGCAWLLLTERPGWRIAIVLLLGISGIMWLGSKYGLICAALGLIGLMRLNMKGRLTLVVLTVAAGAAYGWFHLANYGGLTPYSVNVIYAGHSAPEVLGMHLEIPGRAYRLVGLWVDREFGVWRWAPALLLVLPGIPRLLRRTGTAWWLLVLVFGGALCTAAFCLPDHARLVVPRPHAHRGTTTAGHSAGGGDRPSPWAPALGRGGADLEHVQPGDHPCALARGVAGNGRAGRRPLRHGLAAFCRA